MEDADKTKREKQRAANKRYKAENREKVRAANNRYRAENPEKLRAARKRYDSANHEKKRAATRKWNASNPEKRREQKLRALANRRARKIGALGIVSRNVREMLRFIQFNLCIHCGTDLARLPTRHVHLDHLHPLAIGGKHEDANLALSCGPCNISRGGMVVAGFKGPLCA